MVRKLTLHIKKTIICQTLVKLLRDAKKNAFSTLPHETEGSKGLVTVSAGGTPDLAVSIRIKQTMHSAS
jgi:hypothetical protein